MTTGKYDSLARRVWAACTKLKSATRDERDLVKIRSAVSIAVTELQAAIVEGRDRSDTVDPDATTDE